MRRSASFHSSAVRFFSLGVYCGRQVLFTVSTRRKSNPTESKALSFNKVDDTALLFIDLDFESGEFLTHSRSAVSVNVDLTREQRLDGRFSFGEPFLEVSQ